MGFLLFSVFFWKSQSYSFYLTFHILRYTMYYITYVFKTLSVCASYLSKAAKSPLPVQSNGLMMATQMILTLLYFWAHRACAVAIPLSKWYFLDQMNQILIIKIVNSCFVFLQSEKCIHLFISDSFPVILYRKCSADPECLLFLSNAHDCSETPVVLKQQAERHCSCSRWLASCGEMQCLIILCGFVTSDRE